MKAEDFLKAVEIITKSNSPRVSFRVPVKDSYQNIHDILIHNSNASLIDQLVEAGFSLNMCDKGLIVNKY